MTDRFPLIVWIVCVTVLPHIAVAEEPFYGSDVQIEPQPSGQTEASSVDASPRVSTYSGTATAITTSDVQELTSWARAQLKSGKQNHKFTAADIAALEAWIRALEQQQGFTGDSPPQTEYPGVQSKVIRADQDAEPAMVIIPEPMNAAPTGTSTSAEGVWELLQLTGQVQPVLQIENQNPRAGIPPSPEGPRGLVDPNAPPRGVVPPIPDTQLNRGPVPQDPRLQPNGVPLGVDLRLQPDGRLAPQDPRLQPNIRPMGADPRVQPDGRPTPKDPGAQPPLGSTAVDPRTQPNVGACPVNPQACPTNLLGTYDGDLTVGNYLRGDLYSFWNGCCQSGLVGGFGTLNFWAINEPSQFVTLTDLTTGASATGTSDPGLGKGIRTWAGLQQNGIGFRFGYTHFRDEEIDSSPIVPNGTTPFGFNEEYYLGYNHFDLELTKQFCFKSWFVDTSFGGRHTRLARHAKVVGYGRINDVDVAGIALGAYEIEGTGFTFAIGARKPIFCGWNLFWNYRGSSIWSKDASASALTDANVVTDPAVVVGSAHSRDVAFANSDAQDIFISEVQIGLEYQKCLQCLPGIFFIRGALEYQHWGLGDIQARSNSLAFLQGQAGSPPTAFGARVDGTGEATDESLDLFGISLGFGLRY